MTLYGPLTAQNFLRLLKRVSDGPPDRAFFEDVLDAIVETLEAERGFLLQLRENGGFRVLAARKQDQSSVSRPHESISLQAIRRAIRSPGRMHHTRQANLDRRYRTEEVLEGRRGPRSILVLFLDLDSPETALYLDHRFQEMDFPEHARLSIEHWNALLKVALGIRERERLLRRRDRELARQNRKGRDLQETEPLPAFEPVDPVTFHGMWTRSAAMVKLFESVKRLASSEIPIMICGETGTGKDSLALAIHRSSGRAERPFLSVNCGALPETLLESELFGHVRGAFTGADSDRHGLLVEAEGGSLFLDEVGDMSPEMQKKLLRFLENGRFRPLGSKVEIQADVRLLSATRLELDVELDSGRFRPDLYYRLCGVELRIPPLRERREDITGLADLFLERHAGEMGTAVPELNREARRWLLRYPWQGNVRELENLLRQVIALGLDVVDGARLTTLARRGQETLAETGDAFSIDRAVEEAERQAIRRALGQAGGNKSRAAELLGITRKSLYRRLVKYGFIERDEESREGGE